MSQFLSYFLFFAFTSVAAAAVADDTDDEAAALFEQGRRQFESAEYNAAAQAFRKAYELKPSWKLLYNIAQSEAAAKNYGRALDAFEQYLQEGGDAISVTRETEVAEEMARLKLKVGNLLIKAPAGAEVLIDDVTVGNAPLAGTLRLTAASDHHLLVRQGDQVLLDRQVRISSEQTLEVTVRDPNGDVSSAQTMTVAAESTSEKNASPDNGAPVPTPPSSQYRPLKITGWSLIAAGGAILLTSVITGGVTLSKANDLQHDCPSKTCTDENAKDRHDSAKNIGIATNILLVTGGITAVTGLGLLLLHRKKSTEQAISFLPLVTPETAGIIFDGRF